MATSRFTLIAFLLIIPMHPVFSADDNFEYKVQTQLRFDDRSNREHRFQYRVRAYSAFHIPNSKWSINAFGVTGNEFSSSYNTIDSDISNHFNLRHIYFKHTGALGSKTEIGVIPTYKGRVSSSGLAKDGWIKGARHVYAYSSKTKFEMVLGELEDDKAETALDAFKKLNYVELEMSSYINDVSSYEISLERMTQANFVRAEYRLFLAHSPIYSFELISRVSTSKTKVVIGIEDSLTLFAKDVAYYAYYSYVSDNFGARAELTEDFITTGHGLSIESDTVLFNSKNWKAFARFDLFDQNSRFILGVGYTFE
jgi:hypothetical protein